MVDSSVYKYKYNRYLLITIVIIYIYIYIYILLSYKNTIIINTIIINVGDEDPNG